MHAKRKSLCLQLPRTSPLRDSHSNLHGPEDLAPLSLTQQSGSLATPQIIDETPTPSGFAVSFLRGYEELAGLGRLDELRSLGSASVDLMHSDSRSDNSNPFAETFKKATQMSPALSDNDEPSLVKRCNSPEQVYHSTGGSSPVSAPTNDTANGLDCELFKQPSALPVKSNDTHHCSSEHIDTQLHHSSSHLLHPYSNGVCRPQSRPSFKIRKETGRIQLNRKAPQRILPKSVATALPISLPISMAMSSGNEVVRQTTPTQPEYQLFLKLPTGQSVQIPMIQPPTGLQCSVPTVAATAAMLLPAMSPAVAQSQYAHVSTTDMSLMSTKLPHSVASTSPCADISTTTLKTIRSALMEEHSNQSSSFESMSPPITTSSCSPSSHLFNAAMESGEFSSTSESDLRSSASSKKSCAKNSPHESAKAEPKDRKSRCLERNREAAMRCRTRRKVFVGALQEKAEELQMYNQQLQSKVDKLSREVNLFKSALLSHKDCPVFNASQKNPNAGELCWLR